MVQVKDQTYCSTAGQTRPPGPKAEAGLSKRAHTESTPQSVTDRFKNRCGVGATKDVHKGLGAAYQ